MKNKRKDRKRVYPRREGKEEEDGKEEDEMRMEEV